MAHSPNNRSKPQFDPDRPLADPKLDEFDRAPFAAGVARCIDALPRGECFVIGIHGPWGDGKTTALRFIEASLTGTSSIKTVWYNPWRFVTDEAMFLGFFNALASTAGVRLRTLFERLASIASKGAKAGGIVSESLDKASTLAADQAAPTLETVRERLVEGLRAARNRFVVFIDDIDRLDAPETAVLFRLIKASTDLPNVVYVLAFDREQVAATLGEQVIVGGVEGGRKFLEKIVQIPLALPPATETALDRVCKQRVHALLDRAQVRITGEEAHEWDRAFSRGVAPRLRTPRHIQQYLNAVSFAVPMLKDEINVVDLLLVEALRVFYPEAYEAIRLRLREFVGIGPPHRVLGRRSSGAKDLLSAEKKALADDRAADALESLVEELFPRSYTHNQGFRDVVIPEEVWTRERRVCSPTYASRYFSYAVGSEDVADKEIEAILREADAPAGSRLQHMLAAQASVLKQAPLIAKLTQTSAALTEVGAARLAAALATLSEQFPPPFSLQEDSHAGVQAARLAARLCASVPTGANRRDAVIRVLQTSEAMWFTGAFMRVVDPRHTDPRQTAPFLAEGHLQAARDLFVARLNEFTQFEVTLLQPAERWKFELLFPWARAAGRQTVHDYYVPRMRTEGTIAIRMLQCLATPVRIAGAVLPPAVGLDEDLLDDLELIVNVHEMHKLLMESWMGEERRKGPDSWNRMKPDDRILAEFWYLYPQWKASRGRESGAGRPPNSEQ